MGSVVNLQNIRAELKKNCESNYIDAIASITILEDCVKYLNMNNLMELQDLKKEIDLTIKKLKLRKSTDER